MSNNSAELAASELARATEVLGQPPQSVEQPAAAEQVASTPIETGGVVGISLPLKPRSEAKVGELRPPSASTSSLSALAGSLAIVLGLFFLVAWLMRRGMPKGSNLLSNEVVEVLGRKPLAGRLQMHLLRCGNKLLLVSVSSGVAETLTEITDPEEVDRLAGLCRAAHPQSATASFRHVMQQFGREADDVERRFAGIKGTGSGTKARRSGVKGGLGLPEDLDV